VRSAIVKRAIPSFTIFGIIDAVFVEMGVAGNLRVPKFFFGVSTGSFQARAASSFSIRSCRGANVDLLDRSILALFAATS
jgi:hypothetical protein